MSGFTMNTTAGIKRTKGSMITIVDRTMKEESLNYCTWCSFNVKHGRLDAKEKMDQHLNLFHLREQKYR